MLRNSQLIMAYAPVQQYQALKNYVLGVTVYRYIPYVYQFVESIVYFVHLLRLFVVLRTHMCRWPSPRHLCMQHEKHAFHTLNRVAHIEQICAHQLDRINTLQLSRECK